MNELDQFVKRQLKCKHYFRYVDDLVLLGETRRELEFFKDAISGFLKKSLDLNLSEKKTKIQSVKRGIDFLGYFVKPDYVLVRKRVVGRLMFELNRLNENPYCFKNSLAGILAMANSYFGHFRHADSFNLRKSVYENKLGKLKEKFVPKPQYVSLTLKSCYNN